jgi:hypothetical protein
MLVHRWSQQTDGTDIRDQAVNRSKLRMKIEIEQSNYMRSACLDE